MSILSYHDDLQVDNNREVALTGREIPYFAGIDRQSATEKLQSPKILQSSFYHGK